MVLNLITFVLFSIVLILWLWSITIKSTRKFDQKEIIPLVKDEATPNTPKFVSKGLGTLIKWFILSFLHGGKNSQTKDTMYDKLYEEFGSPKSKTRYAILFHHFLISPLCMLFTQSYEDTKSILCSEICSDRIPKQLTQFYYNGSGKGILFNGGDEAKELRRYTMKTLGQLGFGKTNRMSEILYEQLDDLLENFENLIISTNNKIQVENLFTHSVINIVWCTIGGDKFDQKDKQFLLLRKNIEILGNFDITSTIPMFYFPKRIVLFLDKFGFEYQNLFTAIEDLVKYFHSYIEEKKLRLVATDPTDFVEHFLLEIEKYRLDNRLMKIYCQEQLSYVLMDLFGAGMDTTSKYMESAFMFLALNPDVQVKIQDEIDAVVGVGAPSYATHRKRMLYTEATMMEIHRMASIVPIMPRLTNKDWDIDGQHFKKETFVIANFYFFRMDETYWGDPKIFRPERFLDSENKLISEKISHVLPFGAGSRGCLGESVATASIFIFLTGILQRYSLIQSDPNEVLGLTKRLVTVNHPEPFHISLIPRNA